MANKPILCLDFDGVIHSYTSGWKGPRNIPDPAIPGALEFIVNMQDHFSVHIFSSRSNYIFGRRAMKKWLYKEFKKIINSRVYSGELKDIPEWLSKRIPFDFGEPFYISFEYYIKDVINNIKFPKHKPPALLTIDDRAIQFKGEWPTLDFIQTFKPYKISNF